MDKISIFCTFPLLHGLIYRYVEMTLDHKLFIIFQYIFNVPIMLPIFLHNISVQYAYTYNNTFSFQHLNYI